MTCTMLDISKFIISEDATVKEALIALNNLYDEALTLFVVDREGRMTGTLTDGDVRRKLIEGITLDMPVSRAMNRNFYSIRSQNIQVNEIHLLKGKGVTLLPCLDKENRIMRIYNLKKQKSLLPVDAVLMAGGKGERLRPLTEKVPKPLLHVGEKPIIDYNVDRLISYGIDHISVTVNYLGEQIEAHYKTVRQGIRIHCVREPEYLGTMGSVKFVENFANDTILVMNSDLFTNIDYEDFFLHFQQNGADMSVAAVPYSISVPYGIFEMEGRNIYGIKEKPTYNYYANGGIYLIRKALLDLIPENTFFNATDFIDMLIRNGYKVIRFPITGYWIDIGKHEDFKKAQELVKHL